MSRLPSILLWSVITAAFVGPGTVTTAAASGAGFGLSLLWALVFSTLACLVLQEASARLRIVSGKSLGSALRGRYPAGPRRLGMTLLVLGAIVVGCAAYQAGNILGGVAGATLAIDLPVNALTVALGVAAGLLLWFKTPRSVARLLSLVVAVMGLAFLITAWQIGPSLRELVRGAVVPSFPDGAGVLVLGLIGTTVVPYNLFLGSALAAGENLRDLRFSLSVAIGFGGIISMGVLIVGSSVIGSFSFESLARVLEQQLGSWSKILFAVGLLGAGFSSAVTAPLAAAVTAAQILGIESPEDEPPERSWKYRLVWLGVLASGVVFGLSDVKPIPAIVLAQALNGLLLPIVSVFLLEAVNDRALMAEHRNRRVANLAMALVVFVSALVGVSSLFRAFSRAAGFSPPGPLAILIVTSIVAVVCGGPILRRIRRSNA
ncbi:MAG: divalent metal cation transporter [Acidobacteriota bacterium]